jgi:hypothetical protein
MKRRSYKKKRARSKRSSFRISPMTIRGDGSSTTQFPHKPTPMNKLAKGSGDLFGEMGKPFYQAGQDYATAKAVETAASVAEPYVSSLWNNYGYLWEHLH